MFPVLIAFPGCSQSCLLAGHQGSQFPAAEAVSLCCSESPHGERALAEDSVQDVTAEHHTSDDGMGFTGGTGAACLGEAGVAGPV